MAERYQKWLPPKTGVAFFFDVESLLKTHGELWRPLDKAFVESILFFQKQVKGKERLEAWGGIQLEREEKGLLVLLSGTSLSSTSTSTFYGHLREKLPEGTVVFAGSPKDLPEMFPLYGVTQDAVFRCAVSVNGASPALRVLVYGANGPLFRAVNTTPVNLAAVIDKVEDVQLRVADMSHKGESEYTEEGDRIDAKEENKKTQTLAPPPPSLVEEPPLLLASQETLSKERTSLGGPAPSSASEAFEMISEAAPPQGTEQPTSVSNMPTVIRDDADPLSISEADVVSIREVNEENTEKQTTEETVAKQVSSEAEGFEAAQTKVYEEGQASPSTKEENASSASKAPAIPVDNTSVLLELIPSEEKKAIQPKENPAIAFALSGVSAERTLIDIGDEDITESRPIAISSPLASLSDSELRVILTAAPTEETCQRLGAAFDREPAAIARVFALASGLQPTSETEGAFAIRACNMARSIGWIFAPDK